MKNKKLSITFNSAIKKKSRQSIKSLQSYSIYGVYNACDCRVVKR